MKGKKGVKPKKTTLARRAVMVGALRREIARIAEGVTFGVKLGGGIELVFASFTEFRAHESTTLALPPPWFTEWA